MAELLAAGSSVVVDNTSPALEDRAPLVAAAREAGEPVRAVLVDTAPELCRARNDVRQGRDRVPLVGVLATRARFVPPTTAEGFERIDVVCGDDGTAPVPRPGAGTPGV